MDLADQLNFTNTNDRSNKLPSKLGTPIDEFIRRHEEVDMKKSKDISAQGHEKQRSIGVILKRSPSNLQVR